MENRKISLAGIQGKLSRSEMKSIMAGTGGTCCAHSADWTYQSCGHSMSRAQELASQYASGNAGGNRGYWCCASC